MTKHYDAEVHVRPVSNPDAIETAHAMDGTVSRDAGIVDIPDRMDAWPVRPRDTFTIRFTAIEDTLTPVMRAIGESTRYACEALRDTLNEWLLDMLISKNERSARKTANARRNRLRRKRNRRRRRRG